MSRQESDFEFQFYDILNNEVVGIIKPTGSWEIGDFVDNIAAQKLVDKILGLLFGKCASDLFHELSQLNNPSNICGYVFKPGELSYTCRECAVDPTCVLCQKCFKESIHSKHKYKMHTSGGGGCCDCGDHEAWHRAPTCTIHNIDYQEINKSTISQEIKKKSENFFEVILKFIFEMANNIQSENITVSADEFIMMVLNDESHTFDYVIKILQKAVPCTETHASDYATIIDREGRTPIRTGSLENCNIAYGIIEQGIAHYGSRPQNGSLKGKVMSTKEVALQEFSVILMKLVNKLALKSDGLRNILSQILLSKQRGTCYATSFIKMDTKLWKVARSAYHQIIMSSLMMDREHKLNFAVEFVRNYQFLIDQFVEDDHKHTDSITSISVQIFTVPTIVNHLVEHENLLTILLHSIFLSFGDGKLDVANSPKVNLSKLKSSLRKQYIFYDLKYVLCNVPTDWKVEVKSRFLDFFQQFTNMFSVMEGMDGVVRKTGRHLEHEPEWETGVTLQIRFVNILQPLFSWCASQLGILLESIQIVTQKLEDHHVKVRRLGFKVNYNGTEFDCYDYDITREIVSVHYPLTRLLAGLYVEAGKQEQQLSQICVTPTNMMEHSLRAVALHAQVTIGAWRRNGLSLSNQVFYMRENHCQLESFNRDIQMLQACAAVMDPDHFFVALWDKMNLDDVSKFDEYIPGLLEDAVTLLIYILEERYVQGVGVVSKCDIIKRDIIHLLASGPKPYSKIYNQLSNEELEISDWEDILKEVSDFRPALSSKSVAKYALKLDYINQVSPYYYKYLSTEQALAQNMITKMKKSNNLSTVSLPILCPRFTKTFENCLNLLTCSNLVHFLITTLKRCFPDSTQPIGWSDKLIEKILYLIGIGIVEEREKVKQNQLCSLYFCSKTMNSNQGESLIEILGQLGSLPSMETHQENIRCIANLVDEIINRRVGDDINVVQSVVLVANEKEKFKNKELAKKRRLELMREMQAQQKKFLENVNMEEYEELKESTTNLMDTNDPHHDMEDLGFPYATSLHHQKISKNDDFEPRTCILCQDEHSKDCLVMAAFVQKSKVLSKDDNDVIQAVPEVTNGLGLNMSTCSHVMHFECWHQFFTLLQDKEERRPNIFTRRVFHTLKSEFLCPLCSCLSNCILPVIPLSCVTRNYSLPRIELSDLLDHLESADGNGQNFEEAQNEFDVSQNEASGSHMEWFDALDYMESDGKQKFHDFLKNFIIPAVDAMVQKMKVVSKSNDNIYAMVTNTFQVAQHVATYNGTPLMAEPPIRIQQVHAHIVRCGILFSKKHDNKLDIASLLMNDNLLEKNVFGVLVNLLLKRPEDQINPVDYDMFCLKLCTLAQIVQIMIHIDVETIKDENFNNNSLVDIFNKIRSYAALKSESNICGDKLQERILYCMQPYIRSCALFMRYVSNVKPADDLEDRFLLKYLGLSENLTSYFSEYDCLKRLIEKWCGALKYKKKLNFPNIIKPNLLINLPKDYSDVIAMASDFVCPKFNKEDDSICPTMCLLCGEILCSRSYCCQQKLDGTAVGACNYHCSKCSAGFGLFLRIRDCSIVLLNGDRGSKMPAPYVDEHGETDERLRRGNPLTLDQNRSKELNLIWLTHSVGDNIVRDMETQRGFINADWNHY